MVSALHDVDFCSLVEEHGLAHGDSLVDNANHLFKNLAFNVHQMQNDSIALHDCVEGMF